jgi:hypothetical protein
MMTRDALRSGVREWRQRVIDVDGKALPASIPFLRGALATTTDPFAHDELLGAISDEYFRAGLADELLRVQRERVAQHPESAVVWLSLASTLSTRAGGSDEAKRAVTKGVEVALQSNTLIRYALMCQASIAKKIGDSLLFETSLMRLIADAPNERSEDCLLSPRVVEGLPESFCSSALIDQYRRLL